MNTTQFTSQEFYAYIAEKELMGSRCQQCGTLQLPPRPYCPHCHTEKMEWLKFTGTAKLVAYTVIHVAPTVMLNAGYSFTKPYCTGIVELENGTRLSAQILGVDVDQPETIKIGTELKATFIERQNGEEKSIALAFEPVA